MDKIYIFGAGNNAYGVISYVGFENVIAIIDNEKKKQGDSVLGIPIISLDKYILENKGEKIVISAAIYNEIINQLEEKNIYNYSIAPMLIRGMATPKEIYSRCELCNDDNIFILGQNVVVDKFIDWISQKHSELKINIISDCAKEICNKYYFKKKLLIFKECLNDVDKKILSKFECIYDVYEIIEQKRKEQLKKLKKYKDIFKGGKCVIVCNGPSLRVSDLEKLYDDKICTFGCNLIFNMDSDTYWRPDYYVINDFGLYKSYYRDIANLKRSNMFIKGYCKIDKLKDLIDVNYYFEDCRRKYYENCKFSKDISQGVFSGYTVTYDMIQIAAYMGFSEIYIIGADFNYTGDASKKGNHVYDYKIKDKRKVAGMTYLDLNINAMQTAKKYAEDNNIKIYNATRGGKLEVFERKSLDELFEEVENNEV